MRPRLPVLRAALSAVIVPVAITALGGCATTGGRVPPVTEAMVRASRGTPQEVLEAGRRIFAGPCASCHAPDPIRDYTAAEWEVIVGKMARRTRLNDDRQRTLLAYITAVLATPPEVQ